MIEDWSRKGMPPLKVDVLHKFPLYQHKDGELWQYWIRGHHPHWGIPKQGWEGAETDVQKEILYPGKPNERVSYLKDLRRR